MSIQIRWENDFHWKGYATVVTETTIAIIIRDKESEPKHPRYYSQAETIMRSSQAHCHPQAHSPHDTVITIESKPKSRPKRAARKEAIVMAKQLATLDAAYIKLTNS